ncbi:hypothetical protein [Anoxybacillus sp. J5B_2022]|uniref:hypothetical protein n=1 Tax=Anoxybacillus sp. J5B_2022 TaxID=3003246 RepID=UPI002285E7A6|nr:hypothetical protein [Anoxybacillus sp. J5B_2022]MCZ0756729.1 hypothetical protein [Anoxybacillus sp. J5B_2022]
MFLYRVPVAQEDRATSETSMNPLRVASTHPSSSNKLAEEEATGEKRQTQCEAENE